MNLRWNGSLRRFEAEFSSDFQGDLAAVKAAGFKTEGAPGWTWHTSKAGPLTKLRTLRPGLLTISPEAREQYTSLKTLEDKVAESKKALKKKLQADQKEQIPTYPVSYYDVESGCWVDPPVPPSPYPPYTPQSRPQGNPDETAPPCFICGTPVYFYELQNPPTCLWCEKIVLDNSTEL